MSQVNGGSADLRGRYVSRGLRRVGGWLKPEAAALISALSDAQAGRGAVGEIGVHHGKLFLLLELCRKDGEAAVAIDLFDMQDENVDGSGRGNRSRFEQNLRAHARRPADVTVLAANSTALDSDTLLRAGDGSYRLFSVDGGHTAEITVNDLELAGEILAPGGVLIVDDYFNVEWPGVSEGVNRYLMNQPRLVPVGSAHGKTFFTTPGSEEMFRTVMRDTARIHGWRCSDQRFHGTTHVVMRARRPKEQVLQRGQSALRRLPGGDVIVGRVRAALVNR